MTRYNLVTDEELELLEAYIKLLQDIIVRSNDTHDMNPILKLKLKDLYAQMESLGMIK